MNREVDAMTLYKMTKAQLIELLGQVKRKIEAYWHKRTGHSLDWLELDLSSLAMLETPRTVKPYPGAHMVSLGEAAKRADVHISTMRRWVDRGKVRSTRNRSNHRLVYYPDVLALREDLPNDQNADGGR
jgi:hypothetical protein